MIRPSLLLAIVVSATLQGLILFWPVLFPQPEQPEAESPAGPTADTPVVVAMAETPTPEPEPEVQPEEPAEQPREAIEAPAPQAVEPEPEPETPALKPELPEAPAPSTPEPAPAPTPAPESAPPTPAEPRPTPEPVPEPAPASESFASNEPAPGPRPEPQPDAPPVTEPTQPVSEPKPPVSEQASTSTPSTRQGPPTPPSESERETGVVFNFRAADMPRLRELRGVMVLVIDDQARVLDEVDLSDGTPRRKGRLPRDLIGPLARGLENHTTLEYASDQRNTRQRLGLAPNEKLFVALPNRLASEISHAYALKAEQMRRQGQTLGLAACQLEIRGSRVVPVIIPLD
ncbi:MAG: hypothetical protein AAGI68_07115 [Planctomycetota bacterium]